MKLRPDLRGLRMTRDANNGVRSLTAEEITRLNGDKPLQRAMRVASFDVEKRTVELAFSSELEAPRWFGIEILDHAPGAVRMDRMSDGAALLVDHDWTDQVGVIERAWIDADRRGRAVVRFGRSARAEEIFQDVQDGIRKHVSVGYRIHGAKLTETRDGDVDVYLITDWEPYEISFVAVPLDPTVGVGRDARPVENTQEEPPALPQETGNASQTASRQQPEATQPMKIIRKADGSLVRCEVDANGAIIREVEVLQTAAEFHAEQRALQAGGATAERDRARALRAMGEQFRNAAPNAPELAETAINEGHTLDQLRSAILDAVQARGNRPLSEQATNTDIGLSDTEIRQFSFLRAVRAMLPNASAADREAAAFEFEVSRAAARAQGRDAQGIMIPTDILARDVHGRLTDGTRAFNSSTAGGSAGSTGAYGIQTTLMTGSFVDMLRNRNTMMRLAFVMAGLQGNVDIPRKISGATGYWVGEDEDATEGAPDLDLLSLSPKTVAAYTDITRKLAQQTSLGAEQMVRSDLSQALASALDYAFYYGSGTAKAPRGIFNYDGVNLVDFAATYPTFAETVQMETEIAADNADVDSMAYVFNARMRGHFKTTPKFGAGTESTIWEQGGTINGYRSEVTNQIANGDSVFGNFADFIIGLWGGLDLTVDPYSKSKSGGLRLVVFQDADAVLRRAESFCVGRQIP